MALRKSPKADIRSAYPVALQIGAVCALLLLNVAFRTDFRRESVVELDQLGQEVIEMEEIVQTRQEQTPPPPPRPPIPVEVPNDEILEDDDLDLDASLDIEEPLSALPPPPPPDEPEEEPEPEIFVVVEQMPELIGGREGLYRKLRYPETARRAGVEGNVDIVFVVDEMGNVQDARVVRGHPALDEEALRVIREAKFTPGMQRGRPVKVHMNQRIVFALR